LSFKIDEVKLRGGVQYYLTGMAVTSDNKLLLCNDDYSHPKVYIYKNYKTYEDEISFTSVPYRISFISLYNKLLLKPSVDISLTSEPSIFNIITL
jgi:hypothetical protein